MSEESARKIVERWRKHAPPEADVEDVLSVVDAFLKPWARELPGSGSHILEIHHPMFARLNLYDGRGRFTITVHKKRVKKCYIKDILTAIDAIEMMQRVDRQEEKGPQSTG